MTITTIPNCCICCNKKLIIILLFYYFLMLRKIKSIAIGIAKIGSNSPTVPIVEKNIIFNTSHMLSEVCIQIISFLNHSERKLYKCCFTFVIIV